MNAKILKGSFGTGAGNAIPTRAPARGHATREAVDACHDKGESFFFFFLGRFLAVGGYEDTHSYAMVWA